MRRIWTILLLATLLIAFSISPARAVPVVDPEGSSYELVSTAVTWPAARAAALAASYQGVPGHLAIGASPASEGTWTWADEPRAKQMVRIGEPGGSVPAAVYTNWRLGQPDDGGVQEFLLRVPSSWVDSNGTQRYSVRYSAPEPGTLLLFGSALAATSLASRRRRRRAQAPARMRP